MLRSLAFLRGPHPLKRSHAKVDDCLVPPSEWCKRKKLESPIEKYYEDAPRPPSSNVLFEDKKSESQMLLKSDFAARGATFAKFLEAVQALEPWKAHADVLEGKPVPIDVAPFHCKERAPPCIVCHACDVVFEHGCFERGLWVSGYLRDMMFMIIQCIDFISGKKGGAIDPAEGVDCGVLCCKCVETMARNGPAHMRELIRRVRTLCRNAAWA